MIRITVCDGDELFRECLKEYIDNCLSAGAEEYLVDMFSSGADLLDMGIELVRYALVFIEMNRKSGNKMETVLWLKQYCPDSCVVIVADDKRYYVEGYRADVFRYLIKGKGDFEVSGEWDEPPRVKRGGFCCCGDKAGYFAIIIVFYSGKRLFCSILI